MIIFEIRRAEVFAHMTKVESVADVEPVMLDSYHSSFDLCKLLHYIEAYRICSRVMSQGVKRIFLA